MTGHQEMSRDPVELLVPGPDNVRILAGVLVALFAVFAISLAIVPWQQSARGSGRVVAYFPLERQQVLEAPIEGRIVTWHVREGSRVRAGDPIVDLTDNDPEILARLRQEREALVARISAAEARAGALDVRGRSLGTSRLSAVSAAASRAQMALDRLHASEKALAAAEAGDDTARLNVERQRKLFADGLTARRSLELAELDAVRADTEEERARAALRAARNEVNALQAERFKVEGDTSASVADAQAARASALAEIASGKVELARIEVRLARQSSQEVKAPRDGTVVRLVAHQGAEMVKAGEPLAVFLPDTDERAVELWVDGNDVPLISEGRTVRMQFEGWPAVQFTGWPSVAVGTFAGRVSVVDATDDGKGRFRILVVPDPSEPWPSGRFLRQGTRAEGWVLLDQVSLGYELWRQFNGFPPVVALDEAAALTKGGGK